MNDGKAKKLKGSSRAEVSTKASLLIGRKLKNPKNIFIVIIVTIIGSLAGLIIGEIKGSIIGFFVVLIISFLGIWKIGPTEKEIWK